MLTVDLGSENAIRIGAFLIVTALMITWEFARPRLRRSMWRARRWSTNFGLGFLNAIMLPVLMPIIAVEMALISRANGWGLLPHFELPSVIVCVLFVLVFDFTIYWQHRIFHFLSPLWRLHRVHHLDRRVDVSTAVRFHPVSIVLSFLIKLGLIAALGPPALAVIVAEVLLNVTSMFNHSNVYIHEKWDRRLRWVIVTPDMHRIHHSLDPQCRDFNFGFNFSLWDRLFGSYRDQGTKPVNDMVTGVDGFDARESSNLFALLINPWSGKHHAPE